ncbi:hypothetical protein NQ318_013741 [Aromia moschata]|uniref:Uncharacterized protein n=1 Tax=Aromia moschata TaxID=1265417 RepID=A0AAV8ZA22_9CUCU|nr:hypothetical protein NQ318_013741 [Aromia moschata]
MPNLPLLDAVVAQCNDSSTMERLQQVLDLVEGTARWPRSRRRSHEEKSSDSSEDRTALNLSSRPFSSPFREENNRDRFAERPPQSADNPMHYLSLAMNPDVALCTASDGGGRAPGVLNNNGTKTDSSGNYERNEAAEQQAWEPEVVWG